MLNALRHQRNWNQKIMPDNPRVATDKAMCSTPYGIKGIGTPNNWAGSPNKLWSAQRLTASKELEPPEKAKYFLPNGVLNALRHQRNWNLLRAIVRSQVKSVLNALRHQRNWNALYWLHSYRGRTCSTPYGIKGIGTFSKDYQSLS